MSESCDAFALFRLQISFFISDLKMFLKLNCLFRFFVFYSYYARMIFKFFVNLRTGSSNWFTIVDGSSYFGKFKLATTLKKKLFRTNRLSSSLFRTTSFSTSVSLEKAEFLSAKRSFTDFQLHISNNYKNIYYQLHFDQDYYSILFFAFLTRHKQRFFCLI